MTMGSSTSESNSVGRVLAFQARCRGFEPRLSLHFFNVLFQTPTSFEVGVFVSIIYSQAVGE